jgi:hypothetical protein
LLKHGIAGWPQIAIGNKFVSYIRFVQAQSEDRPGARIAASIAKLCSQMVREDTQHQPYLDCLGAPAHQFLGAGMHPILSIPFTLSLMQKNDDGSQTEMLKLSVDIIYSNCILNRVLPFGASSGLV